ncbi:RodZ family helix-turn-helix domain-containing protein [Couchioplanes azureus]|uniref:hypothetical protein n=1 Tax=Couchioplanes caeruleus TaxID=56438 RepID=UPI0016707EF4|nr:hypothetical protein [Couchioplanes caeruleus]GGQ78876.1 hypothetical protein GCM10010166_56010 [Couchioplanes caeruleus subsp. azureus]
MSGIRLARSGAGIGSLGCGQAVSQEASVMIPPDASTMLPQGASSTIPTEACMVTAPGASPAIPLQAGVVTAPGANSAIPLRAGVVTAPGANSAIPLRAGVVTAPGGNSPMPLDDSEFVGRPADAVAGLVPGRQCARAAVASLREAGFAAVEARPRHPDRCRLRDWGGDATIMHLYVAGLHLGRSLVLVPCARRQRQEVGRLLVRHQGHGVYYFSAVGVESLALLVRVRSDRHETGTPR